MVNIDYWKIDVFEISMYRLHLYMNRDRYGIRNVVLLIC